MNNNFLNIKDTFWMQYALILANQAQLNGEVPVGAVLIFNNRIIGAGLNSSISNHDPTAHAEILALQEGGKILKNYRLINTTLYVTLEPCIMCLGAILNSRINRLVLGSCSNRNVKKSQITVDLLKEIKNNTKIQVDYSIYNSICTNLITNFFKNKRN
ncbi:tRNA adenosine(34) deaminase TadA [Buchnera aphidicola]|uniref:tRNA adenosine(34) deaminase TadA n=1 Tax=Buchnera aphidicola TaxID=9 RepID=UPI0034642522